MKTRTRPGGCRIRVLAAVAALAGLLAMLPCPPAGAMVSFDFETPYLVHPDHQVWDFCLVREGGVFHAYYHTIPQQVGHPAYADTIWHAVSGDLRRWEIRGPVLTTGPDPYDAVAMWAPDVVRDEDTGRWAMLYTGVADGMVQRACLAWSDDLESWTKSPANPVFEPDSLTYHWAPDQAWSSFRDPFVFHDGAQWNMLSTAGLRLGGYPGYRRGIVHRAVSSDLENWTDAGVFFEHDGAVGRTRDLESVQYVVRDGRHHLFFIEQDLSQESHPTSHLSALDPADWTMAARAVVDSGWAPELDLETGGERAVFARLAKDRDPRDGTWFVAARFDSLEFLGDGSVSVVAADALGGDWPVRTGDAALFAPVFGDNPLLRDEPGVGPEGHGWVGSGEHYGGPLSGVGEPGAGLGDAAVGRIESRPFTLEGQILRLSLGGGFHPGTCYVALLDHATGIELDRIHPGGPTAMAERLWDVGAHTGATVRLAVVDEETGPEGWIAVDGIEERSGSLAGVGGDTPGAPAALHLQARPNPFNARVELRFELPVAAKATVTVHDLAGREVWRRDVPRGPGGARSLLWDGRDASGRSLPSGTYLWRVRAAGRTAASARATLVK